MLKINDITLRVLAVVATLALTSSYGWSQIPASIHDVSSNLADSTAFDRTADHLVSGAGLVGSTHSINPEATMWLNNGVFTAPNDLEPEITFDLGSVQSLDSVKVWNYNETLPGRPELLGRGVGSADILVADESLVFTTLISAQAFDIAPGVDNVDFGQVIDMTGANARYVKFDILGNHGGDNEFVGLSEVQFFGVPEPSSQILTAIAFLFVAMRMRNR